MKNFLKLAFVSLLLLFYISNFSCFAATSQFGTFFPKEQQTEFSDVQPGDQFEGNFVIRLYEPTEEFFDVSFRSMSGNLIAIGGQSSVLDMSTWAEFPEGTNISLNGRDDGFNEATIPFKIKIPDSIMPGDYLGVILVRLASKDSSNDGEGTGVNFGAAVGLKLRFSVPGERTPNLDFLDLKFSGYADDLLLPEDEIAMKFTFNYKNTGNVALKVFSDVELLDTFGNRILTDNYELANLFPGNTDTRAIVVQGIKSFWGWVDFVADVYYMPFLDLGGSISEEKFEAGTAKIRVYEIPWLEIILVLTVIFLIIIGFLYSRFRVAYLKERSTTYKVKKGDNLQTICEKLNVNPKQVIVANKLKPPYFLSPGQELFIPKNKK